MDVVWLTYAELGVRMGVSPEAARRRAIRAQWARQPGNDGRTKVGVPADVLVDIDARRPDSTPDGRLDAAVINVEHAALVAALEAHVETLKAQLANAEGRADAEAAKAAEAICAFEAQLAAERDRADRSIRALEQQAWRREADIGTLQEQLARSEERAAEEAAKTAEAVRASAVQFAVERERADRAIRAFESLSEKLEAKREPVRRWWRRWRASA